MRIESRPMQDINVESRPNMTPNNMPPKSAPEAGRDHKGGSREEWGVQMNTPQFFAE
jgi:hypothetical protein